MNRSIGNGQDSQDLQDGKAAGQTHRSAPTAREWDWDALMLDALAAGIGAREFWDLTPRELGMVFEAALRRREREMERDTWLAWHVAALVRLKRLPPLRSLLAKPAAVDMEAKRREHAEIVGRMGRNPPRSPRGRGEGKNGQD